MSPSDTPPPDGAMPEGEDAIRASVAAAEDVQSDGGAGTAKPKQADRLIELATAGELYHTPDGTAYADFAVNGHHETWPVRSKGFRRWLTRGYYAATRSAPNAEAMQAALAVIEAKAHFDGAERTVHLRVAGLGAKLYLDLADREWRAVEIDANGWRIIGAPPVRFRRTAGMLPLPAPVAGGTLDELRRLVNVQDERDWVLIVAWLLAALRYRGPYPVLVLSGEAGSAKTFLATLLRALVDPNAAPLRAPPREDRDLFIAATNGHVIASDNVSSLPPWLSDTLCRLATGGGFATRTLYTDADEMLFDAMRPIVLTGIEDFVARGDLADRAIALRLAPIAEERQRPEAELLAAFETARPRILGALLDAMAHGLRQLPNTQLARLPRMADFALWATACEGALWQPGSFVRTYADNRADMDETVIEGDAVAIAVRSLMAGRTNWNGIAKDLLPELAGLAGEAATRAKSWPKSARALSGRLRRVAPNLRRVRIDIWFARDTGPKRDRRITISTEGIRPSEPSEPSETSEVEEICGFGAGGTRMKNGDADGATHPPVRKKPRKTAIADGADDADAKIPASGDGAELPFEPIVSSNLPKGRLTL
jgi:hypothetical protein